MIKAVLFDLDGTIANSLNDLSYGVNLVLSGHGYPTHEVDAYKMFVGNGIAKMIERALPENARDEKTVEKLKNLFVDYYKDHYCDRTAAYDGVKELILALKGKGIKIGVVTNKAEPIAIEVVKKLYGDYFDVIYGQRDGVPTKPDPTSTYMAMEELGVTPQECIFMGDSGVDVECAVNSNAFPVGVLWGFRGEQELLAAGAKAIISKPSQILDLLNK